jgi:small subunit ribosomal protein S8e
MALWQGKSGRKPTGGRLRYSRKKRKFEIGRELQSTSIGDLKRKVVRVRSGEKKTKVLTTNVANVYIPAEKKIVTAKIIAVVENPANPHYVPRNIITKGATIRTNIGFAKVTSRPGQCGTVNAILISSAQKESK